MRLLAAWILLVAAGSVFTDRCLYLILDVSPCDLWGVCSQKCSQSELGYTCSCYHGYILDPDGWTCKPEGTEIPYILYTIRHEIRLVDLDGQASVALDRLRNTVSLDYYDKNSTIFWSDVMQDKIYRGVMDTNHVTDIQEVVSVGLITPEGIAVDWVGENIYWIDSNQRQIEVATMQGKLRSTLVAGNIGHPRAIAVDPSVGLLFWTDWEKDKPRIESCSMSGHGRTVVVNITLIDSEGAWPNGLTLDYDLRRVYWVDARSDTISTVRYDGSDYRVVLRNHRLLSHPFAIAVFGSNVYWTDWKTNSLMEANKFNGSSVRVVQRTYAQPFDLKVYHSKRQSQMKNPCGENNGGCSHLCLLGFNGTADCKCPYFHVLLTDRKTCALNSTFLLYARYYEIRGVDFNNTDFNAMPTMSSPHVEIPKAMDIDPVSGMYYWTDSRHGTIKRARNNGTDIETVVDTDLDNPSGLAVDYVSGNMYFSTTREGVGSIWVSRLDGRQRLKVVYDRKPITSLAIHPNKGKIFWTEDGTNAQVVFVANMDGSNVQQFVPDSLTHVDSAFKLYSLTIDVDNEKLYFISQGLNSGTRRITWCNFDGSDSHMVSFDHSLSDVRTLAVHQGQLYVATGSSIALVHRTGGDVRVEILREGTDDVTSVKIFEGKQKSNLGKNACSENNGGCSQVCVPGNNNNNNAVCLCTDGFKLGEDGKTCLDMKPFLLITLGANIHGISLNASSAPNRTTTTPIYSFGMPATADSQEDPEPSLSLSLGAEILGISLNADINSQQTTDMQTAAAVVDFHAANRFIYWADSSSKTISRIHRDRKEMQTLVSGEISSVQGLSVDWIAENLYWTDSDLDLIQVSKLNGSFRRVLVASDLDSPADIVVHPVLGYMFWTNQGSKPRIERARLDGSERTTIMSHTEFTREPSGLTIDYDKDRLYWCDKALDVICSSNLDGSDVTYIIRDTLTDPSSITVSEEYIYWTDSPPSAPYGVVMRAFKNGTDPVIMWRNTDSKTPRPHDIKVHDEDRQTGDNICGSNNGGCKELCLYIGNNSRICQCTKDEECHRGATVLRFPASQSTDRYVKLTPPVYRYRPVLPAITACVRLKTTVSTGERYFLSHATYSYDNSFMLGYNLAGSFVFHINNAKQYIPLGGYMIFDGTWHHWCFTWEQQGGKWALYLDGKQRANGSGFMNLRSIVHDGEWLLGQDQDSMEGEFRAGRSYVGDLSSINVWDHVNVNITAAADCNDTLRGNVLAWETVVKERHGVYTYNTDLCPFLTEWTNWVDCNATCGEGNQIRTRKCLPTGSLCTGSTVEKRLAVTKQRRASVIRWTAPQSISKYVELTPTTPSMTAVTVCFRMKTTLAKGEIYVLSYATTSHKNALLFGYDMAGSFIALVNNVKKYIPVPGYEIFDGTWHHWCYTWNKNGGKWALYMDGRRISSGAGFMNYRTVPSSGVWIVGQDQDTVGGGFQVFQSFIGDLTSINVWNHDSLNLTEAPNCDDTIRGNVIAWDDVTKKTHQVTTHEEDLCSYLSEWSDWSDCDVRCGHDNQRSRECMDMSKQSNLEFVCDWFATVPF
ncbi:prolow-density lipoprotein receptor-related protein 1 [Lingula anatina]|uniref:Prolow-density lipoprotein receptor-related protein 1 n=1 Tax=Lingula anatina TaxID=7574 RepID=A0A2R2MJE0_LINAN|nr:prolow-density lipoprotein receptor-related protein 1 [Lingula anatina]|eukprot:XP_023930314.1 prolow-density lipoprotein receptor-related protein 1 [Lingula anatina]